MSNNRRAVTLRFNLKEQHDLNSLAEFYDFRDPRDALRLAFEQLVIATNQLQKKIAKEKEDEAAKLAVQSTGDTAVNPSTDGNSGGPSGGEGGAPVADTAPTAVPGTEPTTGE